MGKASRRRKDALRDQQDQGGSARTRREEQVAFAARPFEGLGGETDWVALREILPAATATVTLRPEAVAELQAAGTLPADVPTSVTIATVLPLAWAGLHRADGTVLIATQSGSTSGDASRDLAGSLVETLALEPGAPLVQRTQATANTPRLQDLLTEAPLEVTVHEGFNFWTGDTELDTEAQESLERANASIVPTEKMAAADSAYWCRIGERTHIRLILPEPEDEATDALTRLLAAGTSGLGGDTRLLGAFRTGGVLVPVWDLDPELAASDYEDELAAFTKRYAEALATDTPLTAEERRSRSGLLSRQVTLR